MKLDSVSHGFGRKRVLFDLNLKIVRGQIVSLVGPSGCGKSTLLRAILGTHLPEKGAVLTNGNPVTGPGRDRGIVYQRYSLFPFLTAEENGAFGLVLDKTNPLFRWFGFHGWWRQRRQFLEESAELLRKFKLGEALKQYPAQMSGGMCQRVAIAQALIMHPEILLLDEPFGALDEATREDMQQMLLELYDANLAACKAGEKPPYTILIVTHELNEAMYVADRVVGLSQYWDWKGEGHAEHPGASIVYDAVSPVFSRDAEEHAAEFRKQREEIREAVFERSVLTPRHDNVRFWKECEQGKGTGVMAPQSTP